MSYYSKAYKRGYDFKERLPLKQLCILFWKQCE